MIIKLEIDVSLENVTKITYKNHVIIAGGKYRPIMVDFLLPESNKDQGENPIVDSIGVLSEWTIVAKCALHGLIYMWDLKVCYNDSKVKLPCPN